MLVLVLAAAVQGFSLRVPQPPPKLRCGAPVLVASQLAESIQQTTANNEVVICTLCQSNRGPDAPTLTVSGHSRVWSLIRSRGADSKSWCPYCAQTKALDELDVP